MRLSSVQAMLVALLAVAAPATAQIAQAAADASAEAAAPAQPATPQECGVLPLAEAERITPEAAAFGRAYVPVDRMMDMVNRKLRNEIQRTMAANAGTAELLSSNPGLGALIEQALIDLGNRCYPLHLANLQDRSAQIMSLFANSAQLREATRFTLSAPAHRLQQAGFAMAMADEGELRTLTTEQRQAMLMREVQRTFEAMPVAERTAMIRFIGSPAGQAFNAAQPELQQALAAWLEQTGIALLPLAELTTVQVVGEFMDRQSAAPPVIPAARPAGTPAEDRP